MTVPVCIISSEMAPLLSTGGLGEAVAGFSRALADLGAPVKVILPWHKSLDLSDKLSGPEIEVGAGIHGYRTRRNGVDIWFLKDSRFAERGRLYGYDDDPYRFAEFCRQALTLAEALEPQPQVIHCHDWPTGLAPVYLKNYRPQKLAGAVSVFTFHDIRYPGNFPRGPWEPRLGLTPEHFGPDGLEFFGQMSMVKGGLVYADAITTVSPHYAQLVKSPAYSQGFAGVFQKYQNKLWGLPSGIDYEEFDPAADPALTRQYDRNSLRKRVENKKSLQREYGLTVDPKIPLYSCLLDQTELQRQEQLLPMLKDILQSRQAQLITWRITCDSQAFRRILGGNDFLVSLSPILPSAIDLMKGMRYGCFPLTTAVGAPFDLFSEAEITDFLIQSESRQALEAAVDKSLKLYANKPAWTRVRKRLMAYDFSWNKAARSYLELYQNLLNTKKGDSQ